MKWAEFASLLSGLGPDTALGRIVAIRTEDDKNVLENFTPEQHRIRNEWRYRRAKQIAATADRAQVEAQLDAIKMGFLSLEIEKKKIKCPYCGHEQKIQYAPDAKCRGVFIKCQARHCKKIFEIILGK